GVSLQQIKKLTGKLKLALDCEAVGIRLWSDGRSKSDGLGQRSPCSIWDCNCGDLVCGELDSFLPLIRSGKSFWTNDAATALSVLPWDERKLLRRCRCEGFQSVALIPLCQKGELFGFLQLADRRKERFSKEIISYLEKVARGISIGIGQVRVAEQLKSSEAEFQQLVESAQEGVSILDESFRFKYVNKFFAQNLGYSPKEMVGLHPIDFVAPRDRAVFKRNLSQRRSGRVGSFEVVFLRKDGQEQVWRGVGHPRYGVEGELVGSFAFMTDVTESKAAEEVLRTYALRITEAQELERKKFASELHDGVLQILTSIRFRMARARKLTREISLLGELKTVDGLLSETIGEIRSFSNRLRPRILDDLGLASGVRFVCKEFHERTGLRVRLSLRLKSIKLSSDMELGLFRIVQESLTNITKHSRAKDVSVSFSSTRGFLILGVKDNGKGFSPLGKKRGIARGGLG
ncbi:PAS domain S-box protein, partial [Bdellovibrionota bacterium FG-2]